MDIKLEIIGDRVKVTTPYHEKFVQKARNLRGKWKEGAWWFDDSILDYVREIMIESFGITGETPYANCTLMITDFSNEEFGPVTLFGRTIAIAFGRDSGTKLGDGIIFIKGYHGSAGSVKNWKTVIRDATFEIKDFPLPSTELPDVKKAIEEGWCTIKEEKKRRHPDDIRLEIKTLEDRIAQLKQELND